MKNFTLFLICLFLLSACTPVAQTEPEVYIDLNNLQPLPTPIQQDRTLRVAVAAVISPKGTIESYTDLLNYLSEKTGRPVKLVQRRTYMEINNLIESGEVDVAFVCTSAYIAGYDDFDMQLLVAPQVNEETVYRSLLIVPIDSSAQDIADLKGKVFAFTDPISFTGRVYPTFMIQQLGSMPDEFFSRTFFTYSHDEAIYAVANGLADGANVDSLVYEFAILNEPSLKEKVRVIHTSLPFGIPPVVVNPSIRPQVKAELQSVLLEMSHDPRGQTALKSVGIDRFVLIDNSAYDGVRDLLEEVVLPSLP